MTGKYHIEISTREVHYNVIVKRKFTIISGDSATGKSTLCRLLEQKGVQIKCSVHVVVLHDNINTDLILA